MRKLHDINSAARLLGISPWTVRAYIRRGKLKPVRLGRRVLLEESELERLVAENKTASLPRPNLSLSARVTPKGKSIGPPTLPLAQTNRNLAFPLWSRAVVQELKRKFIHERRRIESTESEKIQL